MPVSFGRPDILILELGRRIITFFFNQITGILFCGCEHNDETGFKQLVVCSVQLQLRYDSRRKIDKGMSVRAFCLFLISLR